MMAAQTLRDTIATHEATDIQMPTPLHPKTFTLPFDQVSAADVRPAVRQHLAEAEAAIEAIATSTERTYASTLGALEAATEGLEWCMTIVGHLESVATTDALRAAYNEVKPEVSAFFAKIPLDGRLYRALVEFSQTDEAAALDPERARLLDKTLTDFRRHGAELPEAQKSRLAEIDVALSKATTKFAENVLDATNAFELIVDDEARVAGLPDRAKAAAKADAEARGKEGYRFTLQAPSLIPALTYLDDRALRETLARAHNTRASRGEYNNRERLAEILALRAEKAALLGKDDFADLVLEERMAKRGAAARAFVADLRSKTAPSFARENDELLAFARELTGDDALELAAWDTAYYAEKLRKARFDFDAESVRPYFEANRVLEGLFRLSEGLFGIRIEEAEMPTWDPAVRTFLIRDAGGEHLASFYADLYPRENKRAGAWMNPILSGVDGAPQLGLFCANVQPPVGDAPALLSHRDVETLFHEFGHLLHHSLSRVSVRSLAGTNVAWDFVELPSQIMENWCWERESLDIFARHHETGEPIPDALFEKMSRARTFRSANGQMRQLGFASVDLALHTQYDPAADGDVVDYANGVLTEYAPAPLYDGYAMICAFTHLFASPTGYAAGYYSYKWAEVLDADAFGRFREEGVMSAETGRAFRDTVLARGNAEDPAKLFEDFRGRAPALDALLERLGIAA